MTIQTVQKRVGEAALRSMVFSSKMALTESIASVTSVTVTSLDGGSAVTASNYTVNAQTLQALFSGGTTGKRYRVTAVVVTDSSPAQTLEMVGILEVINDE